MTRLSCFYDGKEYTHGSEICQAGSVKRCIDGDWLDLGRDCNSKGDIETVINELRVIDDTEATASIPNNDQSQLKTARTIIVYGEYWSIRKQEPYLFFKGSATPGGVCSNQMQNYRVPLEDVISIGSRTQCRTNPTTYHQKITYIWPD